MECVEARALKSSFVKEMGLNSSTQQVCYDDIWCVTGFTSTTPSDDFSIDEFFDLPKEDTCKTMSFLDEEDDEKYSSCFSSFSSQDPVDDSISNSLNFSPDLAIPVDDVQELELWSHLMDDSVPEAALACPKVIFGAQIKETGFNFDNRFQPSLSRVSGKPRSKRPRLTGSCSWFTGLSQKTESSSSSIVFPSPVHKPCLVKTPKKKPGSVRQETGNPTVQRRCSHCQVTKTPQWRAGPVGPKSLCNACGVRFKSGRLFPEYRPACSPTFSSVIHSNSHRKVLEMRRKKEMTGLTPTVLNS